jgi:hypothetical protein
MRVLLHASVLLATGTCVLAGGVPESKSRPVEVADLAQHVVWERGHPLNPEFVPSHIVANEPAGRCVKRHSFFRVEELSRHSLCRMGAASTYPHISRGKSNEYVG